VSGPGAPFAASAHADRSAARLGEPFTIEIVLRHGDGDRWTLAPAQDVAPLAIRSGGCETRASGGEGLTRCTIVAARVDLGDRAPALRLHGEGPGGTADFAVSAPAVSAALVTDPAVPAREIPLAGMAPPWPLLVPTWRPVAWGGAGLAVLVALALVARRALQRRRPRPIPRAPSPAEALRRELALAEAGGLATRDAWFRLAAAVSAHAAAALALPAPAMTGAELVARARRAPAPAIDADALAAFFADADLVRFARRPPSAADAARALSSVRALAAGGPP
jgi:hypothetical protein